MEVKTFLSKLEFRPSEEEARILEKKANSFAELLRKELKRKKISAEVFIGGSLAKATLVKKKVNDIDMFVRFDKKHEDISSRLESVLPELRKKNKYKITKIHGSRDYFMLQNEAGFVFEVVPVIKIKNPREAENVTDLSYFHVKYTKNKMNKELARQIAIMKTFCKAQDVYGAESYIGGFSGYGIECLIIYYKSFEKMAKALVNVKSRLILDPGKKYKKRGEISLEINESKMQSPIVLIDPTWKERNVLAALSNESFQRFQKALAEFLRKPSLEFFKDKNAPDKKELIELAKKKKAELVELELKTDRQEGDIAGTKLKRFYNFLARELESDFSVLKKEFYYSGNKKAKIYFVLAPKGEKIKVGPFTNLKKHCEAFRKEHKNIFEKNGRLYATEKINKSAKKFIEDYTKGNEKKINEMGIIGIEIE